MNSFSTVIRSKPVDTCEFSPQNNAHRYFDTWIEFDEILHQVFRLARVLKDVEDLTIMPILTGAGVFNTILGQKLNKQAPNKAVIEVPVVARSYGGGQEPAQLQLYSGWIQKELVDDRNVLILDDIYDSGQTASDVTDLVLSNFHPADVRRAFLVRKAIPNVTYDPDDFYLFEVPAVSQETGKPLFFAGVGMDYNYRYRNLDRVIDVNSGRPQK